MIKSFGILRAPSFQQRRRGTTGLSHRSSWKTVLMMVFVLLFCLLSLWLSTWITQDYRSPGIGRHHDEHVPQPTYLLRGGKSLSIPRQGEVEQQYSDGAPTSSSKVVTSSSPTSSPRASILSERKPEPKKPFVPRQRKPVTRSLGDTPTGSVIVDSSYALPQQVVDNFRKKWPQRCSTADHCHDPACMMILADADGDSRGGGETGHEVIMERDPSDNRTVTRLLAKYLCVENPYFLIPEFDSPSDVHGLDEVCLDLRESFQEGEASVVGEMLFREDNNKSNSSRISRPLPHNPYFIWQNRTHPELWREREEEYLQKFRKLSSLQLRETIQRNHMFQSIPLATTRTYSSLFPTSLSPSPPQHHFPLQCSVSYTRANVSKLPSFEADHDSSRTGDRWKGRLYREGPFKLKNFCLRPHGEMIVARVPTIGGSVMAYRGRDDVQTVVDWEEMSWQPLKKFLSTPGQLMAPKFKLQLQSEQLQQPPLDDYSPKPDGSEEEDRICYWSGKVLIMPAHFRVDNIGHVYMRFAALYDIKQRYWPNASAAEMTLIFVVPDPEMNAQKFEDNFHPTYVGEGIRWFETAFSHYASTIAHTYLLVYGKRILRRKLFGELAKSTHLHPKATSSVAEDPDLDRTVCFQEAVVFQTCTYQSCRVAKDGFALFTRDSRSATSKKYEEEQHFYNQIEPQRVSRQMKENTQVMEEEGIYSLFGPRSKRIHDQYVDRMLFCASKSRDSLLVRRPHPNFSNPHVLFSYRSSRHRRWSLAPYLLPEVIIPWVRDDVNGTLTVFEMKRESVYRIVRLMTTVDVVLGAYGAGLFFSMFMPVGGIVVEVNNYESIGFSRTTGINHPKNFWTDYGGNTKVSDLNYIVASLGPVVTRQLAPLDLFKPRVSTGHASQILQQEVGKKVLREILYTTNELLVWEAAQNNKSNSESDSIYRRNKKKKPVLHEATLDKLSREDRPDPVGDIIGRLAQVNMSTLDSNPYLQWAHHFQSELADTLALIRSRDSSVLRVIFYMEECDPEIVPLIELLRAYIPTQPIVQLIVANSEKSQSTIFNRRSGQVDHNAALMHSLRAECPSLGEVGKATCVIDHCPERLRGSVIFIENKSLSRRHMQRLLHPGSTVVSMSRADRPVFYQGDLQRPIMDTADWAFEVVKSPEDISYHMVLEREYELMESIRRAKEMQQHHSQMRGTKRRYSGKKEGRYQEDGGDGDVVGNVGMFDLGKPRDERAVADDEVVQRRRKRSYGQEDHNSNGIGLNDDDQEGAAHHRQRRGDEAERDHNDPHGIDGGEENPVQHAAGDLAVGAEGDDAARRGLMEPGVNDEEPQHG